MLQKTSPDTAKGAIKMAEKNFRTDNKSFMIYKDWEEMFEALDSFEDAGRLIMALFAYAGRGEKPDFGGALKMAFMMMSAQLDRDGEKWDKVCERNRKVAINRWSKKESTKSTRRTKNTDIDTVIVIDTEKDLTETPFGETTMTTTYNKHNNSYNAVNCTKFVPPSLEEVRAYCEERGNGIDAQYFMDYYSARGWKVGRNVITDWKAVVRNWERREAKSAPEPERPAFTDGFDLDKFYSYADSYDPEKIRFTDD